MSEIKSHKQKKERGVSVQQVIDSLQEDVGKADSIAVVVRHDNNTICTAYSGDSTAELIGLIEVLKSELVEEIQDA